MTMRIAGAEEGSDAPFFVAVHAGVGQHSKKLESSYKEGVVSKSRLLSREIDAVGTLLFFNGPASFENTSLCYRSHEGGMPLRC
jgi:hypothetical protein